MEETQLLTSALDESETHYFSAEDEDERNNCPKKIIGIIRIAENDKEYDIFQGDTISIGRDPENCNIVLENKSLSRVHAIIEVDKKDGEVLIYDNKAMNHTWKDNKKLKPLVRYELKGGEILKFGSVSAVFQIHSNTKENNKENSTFISNAASKNCGEDDSLFFVPETPMNTDIRKNENYRNLPFEIDKYAKTQSEDSILFVPESQSSPLPYDPNNKNSIDSVHESIYTDGTQEIIKGSDAEEENISSEYKGSKNLEINHCSISSSRLSNSNQKSHIDSELDSIYIADTQVIFQQSDIKTYSVDFGHKENKNSENETGVDFFQQKMIQLDHESQTTLLSSEVCTNKNSIIDSLHESIFDADTQVIQHSDPKGNSFHEKEKCQLQKDLNQESTKLNKRTESADSVDFGHKENKNSKNESGVDFFQQKIIPLDHESQMTLLSSEVYTNKNSTIGSVPESIFDAETQVTHHSDPKGNSFHEKENKKSQLQDDLNRESYKLNERTESADSVDLGHKENQNSKNESGVDFFQQKIIPLDHQSPMTLLSSEKYTNKNSTIDSVHESIFDADTQVTHHSDLKGNSFHEKENEKSHLQDDINQKSNKLNNESGAEFNPQQMITHTSKSISNLTNVTLDLPHESIYTKTNKNNIIEKSLLPITSFCKTSKVHAEIESMTESKEVQIVTRRNSRTRSMSLEHQKPNEPYASKKLLKRKTNPPKLETVAETPPPRKRIKQGSSEKSEVTPSQSPSSRIRKKHIVMFTGYDDPQHQRYMKELGAEIATSAKNQPTVLVTDKVRRTEKFLCALGRGIPIVSKDWVTQSKSVNSILDPYAHIIEDKEVERKYGFNLRNSIDSASKNPLLLNYKIYATKSCLPSPKEIKEIVECAGGSSLKQMPRKGSSDIVIISCPEDKSDVKKAVKLGFNVQDKEFLLTGLLKQKLDFDSHVLSAV